MSTDRTKPRFTTDGPEDGTGRDWHQYFTELRRTSRGQVVDTDSDSDDSVPESVTVTTQAHEVEEPSKANGTPGGLLTWRNRLLANDWLVKVGHSVAWHEATFYKNGNPNQPEHEEEQWWVNATKGGQYLTISYNVSSGATVSARTVRKLSGTSRNLSDKELKAMVEDGSDD